MVMGGNSNGGDMTKGKYIMGGKWLGGGMVMGGNDLYSIAEYIRRLQILIVIYESQVPWQLT